MADEHGVDDPTTVQGEFSILLPTYCALSRSRGTMFETDLVINVL
jgi:hypothetical protein